MARPKPEENAPYYAKYIQLVPDGDILEILEDQLSATLAALEEVPEEKTLLSYAPGKWTVKESFSHLIDGERVFSYRLLRIMKGDQTPLPGLEKADFVVHSAANESGKICWRNLSACVWPHSHWFGKCRMIGGTAKAMPAAIRLHSQIVK